MMISCLTCELLWQGPTVDAYHAETDHRWGGPCPTRQATQHRFSAALEPIRAPR